MIYKNFELYNIAELLPAEGGGFHMLRMPQYVREKMGQQGQTMVLNTAGAEIRFVLKSGTAKLTLRHSVPGASTTALLYYGGVQSGWQTLYHHITDKPTTITIAPHPDPAKLKMISDASGYNYDTCVIRVLFESARLVICDLEGDVRPPREDETPAKRFMMYGSSITHGSLACVQNNTYLSQISRRLNCDFYSYGFAGACLLEKEVCDYISEQDNEINPRRWDFAVLELGINALGLACEEFERRVRYLLDVMTAKNPDKKLFVIDIYFHSGDMFAPEKSDAFREIVKSACALHPGVMHIPGKSLLTSARGLSADFVHPNIDGVREIADGLGAILEANT